MPPFIWISEPTGLIKSFETRHNNSLASALFASAASAVESLHYLDDIDRAYDASHKTLGAHRPDVVDVAHARWATGTCITALNLCAAGLGRSFCSHSKLHELDLTDFELNQQSQKKLDRRAKLPSVALKWVDDVFADAQYEKIKCARNWLVHSRLKRHFTLPTSGPPQRLKLQLKTTQLKVRHVVELARDVATRHVANFLDLLPKI